MRFKELSQRQLRAVASLCFGMAALTFFAGGLGMLLPLAHPASVTAATALGDAQGVPSNRTGVAYPADTTCYVNRSYTNYGFDGGQSPMCPTIGYSYFGYSQGQTDTFGVSVLSVAYNGSGKTAWQNRTYTTGGNVDKGAATCPSGYSMTCDKNGSNCQCAYCSKGSTCSIATATCPNGGSPQSVSGGIECYLYVAPSLSGPSTYTTGTSPTVQTGQTISVQWSCLPSRQVIAGDHVSCTGYCPGSWNWTTIYSYSFTSSVSGSGTGFSPGSLYGAQSITLSSPGTYTYSLTCNGGGSAISVPVTVATPPATSLYLNASPNPTAWNTGTTLSWQATGGAGYDACYIGGGQYGSGVSVSAVSSANTGALTANTQYSFWCHDTYYGWVGPVYKTVTVNPPASPLASITANGQSSLTVRTGATVNIAATFTPASNDPGQSSYIEGAASNPSSTGTLTSTTYAASKSYSFTPTDAGTYTFYADLSTSYYPTATRYATVNVTVVGPSTSDGRDIMGWGWSDQLGWVSLSWFQDPISPYPYGLRVDASGNVTGYAWSDNAGWLSANSADVSACGSAPTLSPSTHKLSGWLKAVNSNSSSWDGCISLSGTGYAVTINDSSSANSTFADYTNSAWSPTVPQWIVFDGYCATTAVSCINASSYNYYQFCFAQSGGTCAFGSRCQNGTGCVTASLTGCLQTGGATGCNPGVKSYRLDAGHTMPLYWNIAGVLYNDCSIDGTDGEHWDLPLTSGNGSGTLTTAPINQKTVFTMQCDNGVFTDSVTANLSPVIKEY